MSSDYTELRRIARKHELFAWPVALTEADADELGDALEELDALRARVEALEAGLAEAADCIESWGAYADSYFQEKHDLTGDVARARALLEQKP